MRIKACIFDMDGLMIDSERVTEEVFLAVAPEFGMEMTHEIYCRLIGRSSVDGRRILSELWPDTDIAAFRKRVSDVKEERYRRDGIPVKEGLFELLDYLQSNGIARLVATSTKRTRAERILKQLDVTDRFDGCVFGDEVTHAKPDPEIFLTALKKAGTKKEETLILEDSHSGILAANRAGIPVIMIPDLLPPDPKLHTEAVLESLGCLPDYLERRAERQIDRIM